MALNVVERQPAAPANVIDPSHATSIGREMLKAELALQDGLEYEHDRALTLPPAG